MKDDEKKTARLIFLRLGTQKLLLMLLTEAVKKKKRKKKVFVTTFKPFVNQTGTSTWSDSISPFFLHCVR